MMEYNKYEMHTLVDLLADETSRQTKMIAANIISGEEFERCKRAIGKIQQAIWLKKKFEHSPRKRNNTEGDWLFAF